MNLWRSEVMNMWSSGIMNLWSSGIMNLRIPELTNPWSYAVRNLRNLGVMMCEDLREWRSRESGGSQIKDVTSKVRARRVN
jgi:hypothetical protein